MTNGPAVQLNKNLRMKLGVISVTTLGRPWSGCSTAHVTKGPHGDDKGCMNALFGGTPRRAVSSLLHADVGARQRANDF